jgi:hypothetical protein
MIPASVADATTHNGISRRAKDRTCVCGAAIVVGLDADRCAGEARADTDGTSPAPVPTTSTSWPNTAAAPRRCPRSQPRPPPSERKPMIHLFDPEPDPLDVDDPQLLIEAEGEARAAALAADTPTTATAEHESKRRAWENARQYDE